jgi:predicted O-linked N-acetylglucosamine transferase (SPINDLY family)
MAAPGSTMTIDESFAHAAGLHRAGRVAEAEPIFRQIVQRQPGHTEAAHHLAICLSQRGDFAASLPHYGAVLKANPRHIGCLNNLGNALQALRRYDAALDCYERVIALSPGNPAFHGNRGNCLKALRRHDEALASYARALALDPDHVTTLFNRGTVLHELERLDEALADFDRAIALAPGHAAACGSRGLALYDLRRYDDALAAFDKAIELDPRNAQACSNRASVLQQLRRLDDALAGCDRALALEPDLAEAHSNRGGILKEMRRFDAALVSLDRAIALKPGLAEAHANRGSALYQLGRYQDALASRERAIALKPGLPYVLGDWLHTRMNCCSWSDLDAAWERVLAGIDRGERVAKPFVPLAIPSTPGQQQHCARIYVAREYPAAPAPLPCDARQAGDRIRIGYLSAAFRNHPGAHLMAHLFECHDRAQFEIVALYVGPPADDPWRRRLEKAFDSFHDVGARSDRDIAALVQELGIDVLIDRVGHSEFARTGVFALRPAPVQVNYLGYPGTMGAPYIDYLIADRTLIPEASRRWYDEKVVYLPHSYMPNDSTRHIADRVFTRAEVGLPDDAFVFCCFNNNYKLTPDVFDIWMRLLLRIGNGVLWLLEGSATASANLCREAERRGVSPRRLVFAPRIEVAEHLARHRCADLFLDTFHYNAHTTTSDALWAGLPVLTCPGEAFASRVAASLLGAVGLPELIARNRDAYEAMALDLATHPERRAAIRQKLAANRTTQPLFDTARYARDLEQAYRQMVERRRAGLPPEHIVIDG